MTRFTGNETRGFMKNGQTYGDGRMDKSQELNERMSIDYNEPFDKYGKKIRNLSVRDNSYPSDSVNNNRTRQDQ